MDIAIEVERLDDSFEDKMRVLKYTEVTRAPAYYIPDCDGLGKGSTLERLEPFLRLLHF